MLNKPVTPVLGNADLSILNLPDKVRYLKVDVTNYVQKRLRSSRKGFFSAPRVEVISEPENIVLNGQNTSFIRFNTRMIYINVNPGLSVKRQWEEALGDAVHENLHDLWDVFVKDEIWDRTKVTILNILMDGRNEQYATFADDYCGKLLKGMRDHVWEEVETTCPRKTWFDGPELWAAAYLSLKVHTGLMATAPELVRDFQSGNLSPKLFWVKVKKALKIRKPPAKLRWSEAWELICKFWLSGNIYQKSKIADEFRSLYPAAKEDKKHHPEERGDHEGLPQNRGEGDTRPSPDNSVPKPPSPPSGEQVEKEVDDEKQPSRSSGSGGSRISDDPVMPADGRVLEEQSKKLSIYLKNELRQLVAPKSRTVTVNSNRIKMQKVLKKPSVKDPWKKKTEQFLMENTINLRFVGDNSGSMADSGKMEAVKSAFGVFHEACQGIAEVDYEIYTSSGFQTIAGTKIGKSRGFNLISGVQPLCGDDLENSLPKLLRNLKGGRGIVFVFTDGQPGNISGLTRIVQTARKTGLLVYGIGLNLSAKSDIEGMKKLFDSDHLLSQIKNGDSEMFAKEMAGKLRNLVRRRLN